MTEPQQERLDQLLSALVDGRLSPAEAGELIERLRTDPAARRTYIAWMTLDARLRVRHAAPMKIPGVSTPTRSVSEEKYTEASESSLTLRASMSRSTFHISRVLSIAALVAFIAIGILAYTLWPGPAMPPVVQHSPAGVSAARIAGTTDARWVSAYSPTSDVLAAGQKLILQSGSAQITFNNQARVIFEGPAKFTIMDAGACRLSDGKLTPHVPDQAKGFQVHTPSGTVTDLGTEFGVFVGPEGQGERTEASVEVEQPAPVGPQAIDRPLRVTEVHVFHGQVELRERSQGDSPIFGSQKLGQSPGATGVPPVQRQDGTGKMPVAPDPNQKSKILSAGQAAVLTANEIKLLPAADPFRFHSDLLNGRPRRVLLTEDFETYDVGNQLKAIGPWIVQSGIRKGQGIHVYDPRAKMAELTVQADPVPNLSPAPAIGSRVAFIAASAQNPRDTFPLLAREIDGKVLTKNCQVLVEFDYMPLGYGIQFSVALAAEVGHTPGIELWRDVDAAKKVAPPGYQWYRLRVLLDVAEGVVREVRAERSHWLSSEGWVRDLTFQPPTPKLDWSTPPRYATFGFPVVSPATPAGNFWLDNVRIEVISK